MVTKIIAAMMHSLVVTDGFMASVAFGLQSPLIALAKGAMKADPLPLMTATVTGMR